MGSYGRQTHTRQRGKRTGLQGEESLGSGLGGAGRVAVSPPLVGSSLRHVSSFSLGRVGGDGMEGLTARRWNFGIMKVGNI